MLRRFIGFFVSVVTVVLICCSPVAAETAVVEKGKKVMFDYTLLVEGKMLDTSEGKNPLAYTHGDGSIIKGLAVQMEGLSAGEERLIVVAPQDAYGNIDPEAIIEAPKSVLPEGIIPEPGLMVRIESPAGEKFNAVIWEVKHDTIVLNFNHPLAGKELKFQIKILSVEG